MAKAHTLVDNFNDNQLDPTLWTAFPSASTTVREVNGRLEIRPLSGTTGTYSISSVSAYDLTGSQVAVEVVRTLRASTNVSVYLYAWQDASNYVIVFVANGRLTAARTVGGTYTDLRVVPYDPAVHRWLRLREQLGITYWEFSADGVTYTVLHQAPNPITLTSVQFTLGAGVFVALPDTGLAVFDNFNVQNTSRSRRVEERRLSARDVRVQAAQVAAARRHDEHVNNNDESNYPDQPLVGNYSKGLRHDTFGDPEPGSYATLLRALQSEDPGDFEEITLGIIPTDATRLKLTNPQAGLAFDIEGPDAQERTIPPAPRFDSEVAAHEMGELYWMAALRDVPFSQYDTDTDAAAAITSLNAEFPRFGGTFPVTAQNLFRGIFPGEQVGPYVSQFLLKGNVDPRKPAGQGRDATDGFISYGSRNIDQRLFSATPGVDYLDEFASWLDRELKAAAEANFGWLIAQCEWISHRVAAHFGEYGPDALPTWRMHVPDDLDRLVPAIEQPGVEKFTITQKALTGLRGSYGGILMVGLATSLAGMPLINPVSVGAGAILGGKTVHDESKTLLKRRQAAARTRTQRHVDDFFLLVSKEGKDTVRQAHRLLRDHFLDLTDRLQDAIVHSVRTAKLAADADVAQTERRQREIELSLRELAGLYRQAQQLQPA